jgi:anti-anti-sigma factor
MAAIQVTEETRGPWHIVSVEGRIDNSTAEALTTALVGAVAAHPQVAVDCSAVDYISSAGLNSLLEGARAARNAARTFQVCAPSLRVRQVLDLSNLNSVLNVHPVLPC